MNLLINIDDEIYRHAQERSEDSNDEWNAMRAIEIGIPIDSACNSNIDAMRAEIEHEYEEYIEWTGENERYAQGMKKIIEIIDKYTKGGKK